MHWVPVASCYSWPWVKPVVNSQNLDDDELPSHLALLRGPSTPAPGFPISSQAVFFDKVRKIEIAVNDVPRILL